MPNKACPRGNTQKKQTSVENHKPIWQLSRILKPDAMSRGSKIHAEQQKIRGNGDCRGWSVPIPPLDELRSSGEGVGFLAKKGGGQ